ncbi:MarR family transcriptional regulator [Paenibacillus sp. 1011MAR3C5]|uniref:MarR family winged helix-turn-helix transcriptional regulator n=1 Tax=Paenibacillus sp. 1011MAR3C5 TaxID=1675787 RepID=UPI000E6BD761|nr:MarR family transcriptional regulator [Paenibacillus sp. 1011MAR3C5]RJE89695.1 MarR family transcriptional regulator [Paenibacillus sp. 1011MAR3C5]
MTSPHRNKPITRMMSHIVRRHHHHVHLELNEHEVYPGQPPLMLALAREGGQSQNELARKLEIKPATLTVMLNRMVKNGLVRREADPSDLRVSRIYLTEKGFETVSLVRETLDRLEHQALQQFTNEEEALFRSFLMRVRDNIAYLPQGAPSKLTDKED